MDRMRRYLIANFSWLFFSIFMPLFGIASLIFMIKLAKFTSVITVTIGEMLKLYVFNLPEILFYLLPITFFVAAAITLHKLSTDNETVVLFALGIRPAKLIRVMLTPAVMLSAVLFFTFFIMFPHTKALAKNFIGYKKSEAKFNLSASEFGHNFGDWLLYIGSASDDGSFGDVFLFNKENEQEFLIGAKKAEVLNDSGVLKLQLEQGEGYSYTADTLSQMSFERMRINDMMQSDRTDYLSPYEYWFDNEPDVQEKRTRQMLRNVLLSLFPVLCLFVIMAIGIVHARHQNSHIYLYIFATTLLYYGITIGLEPNLTWPLVAAVVAGWLGATYLFYRRKIATRF